METTVLGSPAIAKNAKDKSSGARKTSAAFYGYSFLLITVIVGWLLSDENLVNPNQGLGYWLGVTGGSLMGFLLLYPAGKKSATMRRLGLVKHWFRVHMIFGLVGPLLILYHCNFSVHAINSSVAFYSMLAVASSGIIGRYFYTRIHRGLYGKRANIEELRDEISDATQNSRGLAAILPKFVNELHTISAQLVGDQYTRTISMWQCISWSFKYYVVRLRLFFVIRDELREGSENSAVLRSDLKNLRRTANTYAAQQVGLMRQVAQLALFERVFSLWHLFHMPLFLVLVVATLVHILAVHMY